MNPEEGFVFVWKEADLPRLMWLEITVLLQCAF